MRRRLALCGLAVAACTLADDQRARSVDTGALTDTQTIDLTAPRPAASAEDGDTLYSFGDVDSSFRMPTAPRVPSSDHASGELRLTIPVAGVRAEDLLDTFREMRGTRRHEAIDIPAPRGTPVVSAADGRVLRRYTSERGGLMIYATDASERYILMYAHLDGYAERLTDSSRVVAGQILGYVGTTGNAPPNVPHLHFAVARSGDVARWWEGEPIDPLPLLRRSR